MRAAFLSTIAKGRSWLSPSLRIHCSAYSASSEAWSPASADAGAAAGSRSVSANAAEPIHIAASASAALRQNFMSCPDDLSCAAAFSEGRRDRAVIGHDHAPLSYMLFERPRFTM